MACNSTLKNLILVFSVLFAYLFHTHAYATPTESQLAIERAGRMSAPKKVPEGLNFNPSGTFN